jgi:hypothetical protein
MKAFDDEQQLWVVLSEYVYHAGCLYYGSQYLASTVGGTNMLAILFVADPYVHSWLNPD